MIEGGSALHLGVGINLILPYTGISYFFLWKVYSLDISLILIEYSKRKNSFQEFRGFLFLLYHLMFWFLLILLQNGTFGMFIVNIKLYYFTFNDIQKTLDLGVNYFFFGYFVAKIFSLNNLLILSTLTERELLKIFRKNFKNIYCYHIFFFL